MESCKDFAKVFVGQSKNLHCPGSLDNRLVGF